MLLKNNIDKLKIYDWYILSSVKDYIRLYVMAYSVYEDKSEKYELVFRYINGAGMICEDKVEWLVKTYPKLEIFKVERIDIDIKSDYSITQHKRVTTDLDKKLSD